MERCFIGFPDVEFLPGIGLLAKKRTRAAGTQALDSVLDDFLPPVRAWFENRFGAPTPPQSLGWPAIAGGENTLIVAPTGSGKTLAAFLAALDFLWRQPDHGSGAGVRLLYLSPLKALNVDIARNLEGPLEQIQEEAVRQGFPLRKLRVGVRTGDTPPAERQQMLRRPPDILITTPESLHLMLTGRASKTLAGVGHVIVDEIHAVCANKRGVFLSLLLERLSALTDREFLRIGLSATQRPLEEVARYLGGRRKLEGRGALARFEPRPVRIVDAGRRKDLDLQVSQPAGRVPPGGSVWPVIEERLMTLVEQHRSTIVFANNRRVTERLAVALNERWMEKVQFGLAGEGEPKDQATAPIARPHHGSLSLEVRRETEAALKGGMLPAVVATASLEMGIDMGAVELVCQVESPGSISRALQRVGRAGHVVGEVSRGRLFAKTSADLLESAALARAMIAGEVEELRVPRNCLDVLAQQVVACVAVQEWNALDLFDLVRQTVQYADLSAEAFESVLEMVSGRFGLETFRDLSPRLSWDRIHNRLCPLPGTSRHALVGGGTIPDTGQYPLYLGDGGPRLGELDEEFVLERRAGETFRLGQGTWRIEVIEPHRVLVSAAEGRDALMPFWRGEGAGRTLELGLAVGGLTRIISEMCFDTAANPIYWLMSECRLEEESAKLLVSYVRRQRIASGAVPDDRTVLVESFPDPSGETGIVILCPLGSKRNQAVKLVIVESLKQRLGIEVAAMHNDDGVLLRLPGSDEPPLDLFRGLGADEAEALLLGSIGESALFGLRFRQNAGRALLMPRPDPAKRTPLWLQRLRARDLLQAVRRFPNFPIVVETYRECLDDDLDLPGVRAFFDAIQREEVTVRTRQAETPSAFASELIFQFTHTFLYQWDEPRRGDRQNQPGASVDTDLLEGLMSGPGMLSGLDPDAVARVEARLKGVGHPPRTVEEMAERLRTLGDMATTELSGPMAGFLAQLEAQNRALRVEFPSTCAAPSRWILAEEATQFQRAFFSGDEDLDASSVDVRAAQRAWIGRHVTTRALIGLDDILKRYPLEPVLAASLLDELVDDGAVVRLTDEANGVQQWADCQNLTSARRLTLALRRKESLAVTPERFADLVARTQFLHESTRLEGEPGLERILERFEGVSAPANLWESEFFPRRVSGYRPAWLDTCLASGAWNGRAFQTGKSEPRVGFFSKDFEGGWAEEPDTHDAVFESEQGRQVLECLTNRGPAFIEEIVQGTGLSPGGVRSLLKRLLEGGRVFPDRFAPLRPGGEAMSEALAAAQAARTQPRGSTRLGGLRRRAGLIQEPRWTLVSPWLMPVEADLKEQWMLCWAGRLLDRYCVLTRETVALDPWAPPWRELVSYLTRAELRDELRRGYFVEGLSGLQFTLPETVDLLARSTGTASQPSYLLLSSLDPANLYGSGAPFDIPLLEGGTAKFLRSVGNYLVQVDGRPVLIIEAHGRRLTGLGSAHEEELQRAVGLLTSLVGPGRRVLKVETYNSAAVLASPAAPWLASVGFVRDMDAMAYYATW